MLAFPWRELCEIACNRATYSVPIWISTPRTPLRSPKAGPSDLRTYVWRALHDAANEGHRARLPADPFRLAQGVSCPSQATELHGSCPRQRRRKPLFHFGHPTWLHNVREHGWIMDDSVHAAAEGMMHDCMACCNPDVDVAVTQRRSTPPLVTT